LWAAWRPPPGPAWRRWRFLAAVATTALLTALTLSVVAQAASASEPLALASVTVTLVSSLGGTPVSQTIDFSGASCTARGFMLTPNDLCVQLDFASPTMNAMNDTFTVSATASDVAGNPGSATATVPVTRLRWTRSLGIGVFNAAPALDSLGNIYLRHEGVPVPGPCPASSPIVRSSPPSSRC